MIRYRRTLFRDQWKRHHPECSEGSQNTQLEILRRLRGAILLLACVYCGLAWEFEVTLPLVAKFTFGGGACFQARNRLSSTQSASEITASRVLPLSAATCFASSSKYGDSSTVISMPHRTYEGAVNMSTEAGVSTTPSPPRKTPPGEPVAITRTSNVRVAPESVARARARCRSTPR